MYNRYIPGSSGYTRIPEEDDQPIRRSEAGTHRPESSQSPRSEAVSKAEKSAGSLTSLLKSLKLDQLDSGDVLLLLILLFLFMEGDDVELMITLGLLLLLGLD